MRPYTVPEQMACFGIPESEQGPYVTALREAVARKLAGGMIYQSAGSTTDTFGALSYEEQAKARLAWDWAIERRHTYRQECWDPVMGINHQFRDGAWRKRLYFRWRRIPAWIGDRFRKLGCMYRVWRDRGLANPYA